VCTVGGFADSLWCCGAPACASTARALREADLDRRRGSLLVRRGKGGRRREIGMDRWGWQELEPWLTARVALPIGPLFCMLNGRSSVDLQGIDNAEVIETVHARRAPMIPVSARPRS
jgi:hypothetical protein